MTLMPGIHTRCDSHPTRKCHGWNSGNQYQDCVVPKMVENWGDKPPKIAFFFLGGVISQM